MVQVREAHPRLADGSVDIDLWLQRVNSRFSEQECRQLKRACQLAAPYDRASRSDRHSWGDNYSCYLTGLEMAEILANLSLDVDSLTAAIVYRCVREEHLSLEQIERAFDQNVRLLIEGVIQMAAITNSRAARSDTVLGQTKAQTETVRKMLVAMIDDVRVALIKLAERTCAIRAVKDMPERRKKVAKEVLEIYAPLAHRLGIGHIKWELEDLSFRYLHTDKYKRIASLLDERRLDRQKFIDDVIAVLKSKLNDLSLQGEVTGRAKHIYSIWRKMQRKRIAFSQVYDIRAVRILVPEVQDCYAVLGIVHTLWRNIPNEFDDYIATPKENGYRSLHTAVIGPNNKVLEIQIRTFTMHEEAEFGVCAHWRYKGADGEKANTGYEEKIAWLRQVLDWHEETGSIDFDLSEQLGSGLENDKIYVFTRDNHVVELNKGATPLDFAYHIHTEVGHKCRGAKVDGRIVPLTSTLESGHHVEIITSSEARPSRDWLRQSLAYLRTSRARAKVKSWFKQQDRENHIAAGRRLLESEFKRLAMTSLDYKAVADKMNFTQVDDMFAAVGSGDVSTSQVLNAAQQLIEVHNHQYEFSQQWLSPQMPAQGKLANKKSNVDININGVGNLLTVLASCCKPVPGDLIVGYITIGRGVSIHQHDCSNLLTLQSQEPERIIDVSWGEVPLNTYPVDIVVEAVDRHGLLRDITALLANEKVNLLAVNTLADKSQHAVSMSIGMEVSSLSVLSRLMAKINHLPNVISVYRTQTS